MSVYTEQLDDAVHYLRIRGMPASGELKAAIDEALAAGARWIVVDVLTARLQGVAEMLLADAGEELRARRGELVLVSGSRVVADRLSRHDVEHRPALAASVDQALMILELLRPAAAIRRPSPV
jgi:hypothetical protein